MKWLARFAVFVVLSLLFAEVGLRAASVFVRDRSGAWGSGVKILCVGDSHTYGVIVPESESYPAQLQRILDEREPGAYSVVNIGVPGRNTAQALRRLPVNLSRYQPDVVIFWLGINDAWNVTDSYTEGTAFDRLLLWSKVYRFVRVYLHDRHLEQSRLVVEGRRHVGVRNTLNPRDPQTVIDAGGGETTVLDLAEEKLSGEQLTDTIVHDYRVMAGLVRATGAVPMFLAYPLDLAAFGNANAAARSLRDVVVVETRPAIERVPDWSKRFLAALHPDGAMYGEIAADVADEIQQMCGGGVCGGETQRQSLGR